jgi:hypothetical protein
LRHERRFAHIVIDYIPKAWLIESKSLKFYLASFRNHSGFHEECTIAIGKRMAAVLEPAYLRIGGYWYPRGGMPIDVFWETGTLPTSVWLPDQGNRLLSRARVSEFRALAIYCTHLRRSPRSQISFTTFEARAGAGMRWITRALAFAVALAPAVAETAASCGT